MSNRIKNLSTRELMAQLAKESQGLSISDRRNFLKQGMLAAGAVTATTVSGLAGAAGNNLPPMEPEWGRRLGAGVIDKPYGVPSEYESSVVRRTVPWLTAESIASISMTPIQDLKGIITPNGLVFERYHAGVAQINPEEHRLMIHGLVDRPIVFTMEDLMRFPSVSEIKFIECPANGGMEWKGAQMEALQFTHGMMSCCEWTGVPLKVLLEEVGVKPEGKWLLAEGADGSHMSRSIPIEKALEDTLVVYAQNGEMLRPEQGYPLRLLNPGWEGNTSIKWLRRIEVGDKPWYHREETSKYTDLMADGRARKFTFVQETNSVITNPCPEKPIIKSGLIEIEGLAWTGRGKIKQVDISFDGGVSWVPAKLKGLVLDKALTRFSLVTKWDGQPWLLQSRAIDETGYVQPTLGQLREARGTNSIYHKNSIHTWKVEANGGVKNVQIS
ncbi:sulfite dehydrogenase [Amphritea japonica]|uniref:Sulfane dehydrogenase subunit SoxC n=1 Tax=Amphritea japonica ATCC BAA-1530 TaxID=1278309 RepID=A0A7R6PFW9_9GAMM|nr:sulfite dehydrogenase [Amphritea japonica]BBB25722.1 sulfane dehydrogenase subunit SoxC [Amphritea japonica ATCC BAA-1530]